MTDFYTADDYQDAFAEMPGRVSGRFSGILMIVLGLFLSISLATWSVNDPSLTHVTDDPISNWLGWPGAVVADLLTQIFGLGASMIIIFFFAGGWIRYKRQTMDQTVLRQVFCALAIVAFCGLLASLPILQTWPLPTSLGGVIGDMILHVVSLATGSIPSGGMAVLTGVVFSLICYVLLVKSLGLSLLHPLMPALPVGARGHHQENDLDHDRGFDGSFEDDDIPFENNHIAGQESDLDLDDMHDEKVTFADRVLSAADIVMGAIAHWQYSMKARRQQKALQARSRHLDESLFFDKEADQSHLKVRVEPGFLQQDNDTQQDIIDPENMDKMGHQDPDATSQTRERAIQPSQTVSQQVVKQAVEQPKKFELPDLDLLSAPKAVSRDAKLSKAALEQKARDLENVLQDFGVKGEIICVRPGPVVTLYELEPAPGIKSSRVIGLAEDIARSMSAVSARVAVVPGRNVIGIELPNDTREMVAFREMLKVDDFESSKAHLPLCLGKTIGGEPSISDLAKMPHLLIAGTTGSGKSVAINTMILSLLYRLTPDECKLIMIDPKMLELSVYDGIPHLLSPVITDPNKAVVGLKWAVKEMEDRYKRMSKLGVRNIDGFNKRVEEALAKGEEISRTVQTGFDRETGEAIFETEAFDLEKMPFIVVIVDEMADLMMVAGKDIEGAIQRLAQMARAAGIHLIMATQRPSVDVITGTIKANFPTRISFQVTSKIDSRTILGEMGAEQLLGMGDMLYMAGGGRVQRLHGPFVSDKEVEDVVNHLKAQALPEYLDAITEDDGEGFEEGAGLEDSMPGSSGDDLYDQAIAIVMRDQKASTSYIQRRLSIGYNRAATLIERMEEEGIISPANHAGKREVLIGGEQH